MKKLLKSFTLAGLACISLMTCEQAGDTADTPESTMPVISISPNVPHDVSSADPSYEALGTFAWEELIALSWQSTYDPASSNYQRDVPDDQWHYQTEARPYPARPVVWETFAHRSEFTPANGQLKNFNSAPVYDFNVVPDYSRYQADTTVLNCLDENNEIGSCDIYIYPGQVAPYDTSNTVLYQAKTNSREYLYKQKTFPTLQQLAAAIDTTTSNIKNDSFYYSPDGGNCSCPDTVVCLPCGDNNSSEIGAIEIKTAWRKIRQGDNTNDYFSRKVLYYEEDGSELYGRNDTFLLIGIHIIHKTVNFPTFTFATFEHESVTQDSVYYISLQGDTLGSTVVQKGEWEKVERLNPIEAVWDQVTAAAHQALPPNSVWQNYRLTGVQARNVDYPDRDTLKSYYLANFVIESDTRLMEFNGSFAEPHDSNIKNVLDVKTGQKLTMGGCKGCHGQAQLKGSDFSFILQGSGKDGNGFNPDPYLYGIVHPTNDGFKFQQLVQQYSLK